MKTKIYEHLKKIGLEAFHLLMTVLVISFGISVGIPRVDDHSLYENTYRMFWLVLQLGFMGTALKFAVNIFLRAFKETKDTK